MNNNKFNNDCNLIKYNLHSYNLESLPSVINIIENIDFTEIVNFIDEFKKLIDFYDIFGIPTETGIKYHIETSI